MQKHIESPASAVMAGLDPAIHVFFLDPKKDVDTRDKRGHDGIKGSFS